MSEFNQTYPVDLDIQFFYNISIHLSQLKEVVTEATEKVIQFGELGLNGTIKYTPYYGNYLPSSIQKMEEGRANEYMHMLKTLIRPGNEVRFPTPMTEAIRAFIEGQI
jgi:demethoxyubiquinone hydroxylase (CLK1/Coq7/Cat5 family)